MNRKEKWKLQRRNLFFYLIGFLLLFCLKYGYSHAGAPELRWILAPTARWVSILSGIPFSYLPEAGYVNHDWKMVIAPSCSGVQFMLSAAAMLLFSFVPQTAHIRIKHSGLHAEQDNSDIAAIRNGLVWILISFLLSYLYTVFINGLRIIAALYLPRLLAGLNPEFSFLAFGQLHTAIGTVIYFIALLTLYQAVSAFFQREKGSGILQKCLSPVFWYFFIVLGLPFLNRAYEKNGEQFTAFAILVTTCCLTVLLLYWLFLLLISPRKKRIP